MRLRIPLLTGLGLGYAPVASGTFGSAGAAAVTAGLWAVHHVGGCPVAWGLDVILAVLAAAAVAGCVAWGPWAAEHYAGQSRKPGDPSQVVLDEWAGQWVALIGLPMPTWPAAMGVLAAQFMLFRVFDVIKPPPARRLERLEGGWGIALDDVAAGVWANLVGQVLFRVVF